MSLHTVLSTIRARRAGAVPHRPVKPAHRSSVGRSRCGRHGLPGLLRSGTLFLLFPVGALVTGLLLGSGCVRIPRDRIDVRRYSIDGPTEAAADTVLPLTLFVPPFQASAQQRGERIMFRDEEHGMDFYYYHRWIVSPARMVGDVFAGSMRDWGMFGGGVFESEVGMIPTHEAYGRLHTLYADNIRGEYGAVLEVSLTVLRVDPGTFEKEVVFQKSYPVTARRRNSKVDSYVVAVNEAVAQWLVEVRADLGPLFRVEAERLAAVRGPERIAAEEPAAPAPALIEGGAERIEAGQRAEPETSSAAAETTPQVDSSTAASGWTEQPDTSAATDRPIPERLPALPDAVPPLGLQTPEGSPKTH